MVSATTDLAAVAAACGFAIARIVQSQDELEAALPIILEAPGPVYHVIKVRAETLDFVLPPKDGEHLKNRFRRALLGDTDNHIAISHGTPTMSLVGTKRKCRRRLATSAFGGKADFKKLVAEFRS